MDIVKIAMGLILTMAGSQLHWFSAGVAGFIVGEYLAGQSSILQSEWSLLFNSMKYSALNIVLAVVLKPLAAILSAFVLGGYICLSLPEIMVWNISWNSWYLIVFGGVIAVVLTLLIYSFSIIVLSAAAGAILVVQSAILNQFDQGLLALFLVFIGVTCQFILLRYAEPTLE
jgi:hypothetical protein